MIRISWSSLRTHAECKQRSYLARRHNLATIDNKRNFLPGSVTDRVVRKWLNGDPEHNRGIMPDMVDDEIDSSKAELVEKGEGVVRWRDPGDRARVKEECIEAVTKIEPDLMKYVVPFDYWADHHFETKLQLTHPRGESGTVVLNGYMDILVRDAASRWAVWDVKHTRDDDYWRKTVGQLGFYDLSVELDHGQPTAITGLLQPLCKQRVKPYFPSAESRAQLLARIHAMALDIWNDVRTPITGKPGECSWCPTKHACEKFQPIQDSRGQTRVSF